MILWPGRKGRTDLGGFLANTWHPQRHMPLTLQVARLDIKAANDGHNTVELPKISLGKVCDCSVVPLGAIVDYEGSIRCEEPQRVLGIRHGSNLAALPGMPPSGLYNDRGKSPYARHSAFAIGATRGHS